LYFILPKNRLIGDQSMLFDIKQKIPGMNHESLCEELPKKLPYTQASNPGNVFLGLFSAVSQS